jgi:pyridoxine 4-dehydrogenase
VHKVEAIANKNGCTVSQIAIAWVRQLSNQPGMPQFIPIPGATTAERVKENFATVELSSGDLKEIDEVLAGFTTAGEQYPKRFMHLIDG